VTRGLARFRSRRNGVITARVALAGGDACARRRRRSRAGPRVDVAPFRTRRDSGAFGAQDHDDTGPLRPTRLLDDDLIAREHAGPAAGEQHAIRSRDARAGSRGSLRQTVSNVAIMAAPRRLRLDERSPRGLGPGIEEREIEAWRTRTGGRTLTSSSRTRRLLITCSRAAPAALARARAASRADVVSP